MPLLSLGEPEGLTGLQAPITLRTEEIAAVWVQNNGGAAGPVVILMKSGESVSLETRTDAQAEPLYTRIRGAL